jgi:hypothetical protein
LGLSGRTERLFLSAEIDATVREIDRLAYDFYRLTERR